MKRTVTDERLQDYLDGRLSDAERAEIEALLASDARLVERVEAWRRIGRALRDDPAELSPGFYARARARFEATARERPTRARRFLSWEFAGLAAAALVVAAVLGPELLRLRDGDRGLGPAPASGTAERSAAAREPMDRLLLSAPEPEQAPAGAGGRADDADRSPPSTTELKSPAAPAPPAQEADRDKLRDGSRRDAAAGAPGRKAARLEKETPEEARDALPADEGFAPSPPSAGPRKAEAPAEIAAAAEPSRHPAPETIEQALEAPEATEAHAAQAGAEAPSAAGARVFAVELPPAVSLPAGITIVEDRATWNTWLAGPAGPALRRLGAYDGTRRLVLVGRAGADCASLTVDDGPTLGLRVETGGSSSGCAVLLPRDGRPVTFEP